MARSTLTPSKPKRAAPYPGLRTPLLNLDATGAGGFEGLVATALAALTGLTFRLAQSGLQFGRDASTPRGRFAVAMEAKRYRDSMTLEDLVGKAGLAAHHLRGDIDLWVLCATSEVGEGTLRGLEATLEDAGISLLALDWTERPLPRLAVLLAAQADAVIDWFRNHAPGVDANQLRAALDAVAQHPGFVQERERLGNDVAAHLVGLGALTEANSRWLYARFANRRMSRQSFGQFVTIADPAHPAVARPSVETALRAAMASPTDVVAVLGGEGVGKTWTVAQWWVNSPDRPILLVGSARSVHQLDPSDPLTSIATLLALQDEGDTKASSARLLRRLKRWRTRGPDPRGPRFVLLLDGLNESTAAKWADLIVALVPELQQLGGRIVITCREGFWDRVVVPRLRGLVSIGRVAIGDFTKDELSAVLEQAGVRLRDVPDKVRLFVRNPRVCSVALSVLDRLAAQPFELTVERLLLEYWRRRLEERGDLIAHDTPDFERLLRSHARAYLANPSGNFDRNSWREHSAVASRGDGRSFHDDLTEIEEGRFLQLDPEQPEFYHFKRETLPFALGLLIAREISDVLRGGDRDPVEAVEAVLDEIGAFDLIGEAVGAAAGVACLGEGYPPSGRAALVATWLRAQNLSEANFQALFAYAPTRPVALLDAAEILVRDPERSGRREWLERALLHTRDEPRVAEELCKRLPLWFARWSRLPRRLGQNEAGQQQFENDLAEIQQRIDALSDVERRLLGESCVEVADPDHATLDRMAAILVAGRPQVPYAHTLLGQALGVYLGSDPFRTNEMLAWSLRLNRSDHKDLARLVHAGVDEVMAGGPSGVGRSAAAQVLRLLGDEDSARLAEEISPRQPGKGWRLVENYCATDPLDPQAPQPDNLRNAIDTALGIDPASVWNHLGLGEPDHKLDLMTAGLARFQPEALINLLRQICATAPTRRGVPLRQLGWHLPNIAPLFDAATTAAVLAAYHQTVREPEIVHEGDRAFVPGNLLLALLPQLPPEEQLDVLRRLPPEVADWQTLQDGLKVLPGPMLEEALLSAERSDDHKDLRRVLAFASARQPTLTEASRATITRALRHPDKVVANVAANVAYVARDKQLDAEVIAAARRGDLTLDGSDAGFWRSRAVAAAVVSLRRNEDLDLVASRFLSFVARQLEGVGYERLANDLEAAVERLIQPMEIAEPAMGQLIRQSGDVESAPITRVKDKTTGGAGETEAVPNGDVVQGDRERIEDSRARQRLLVNEANHFLDALAAENAEWVLRAPDRNGLANLIDLDAARVGAWVEKILVESDRFRLRLVRNLGLGLASAYSRIDPEKAGKLFDHLFSSPSAARVVFGKASIPLELVALFGATDHPAFDRRRADFLERAMDDATIEDVVRAAEFVGRGDWIDRWSETEITASEPSRIARALMVSGLRTSNTTSDAILGREWSPGFLASVAQTASDAYRRDGWCRTWAERALAARDGEEFWCFAELASRTADRRFESWLQLDMTTDIAWRFGRRLSSRMAQQAEKTTKERRDTLFGLTRPDNLVAAAITN